MTSQMPTPPADPLAGLPVDRVTGPVPTSPPTSDLARYWARATRESLLTPASVTDADAREAAAKGIVIMVRQSLYLDQHSGSRELQVESCLDQARVLGATRGDVTLITAWGERASEGQARPKFEQVLELIRRRLVGLAIFPEHHRVARTMIDAVRLHKTAAAAGVLLHIAGRTYNPANASDRYILEVLAGHAQYENTMRARWGLGSRLMKAEQRQLRLRLPTGLVWVAETETEYFERAANVGLGAWLTDHASRQATDVRVPGPKRRLRMDDAGDGGDAADAGPAASPPATAAEDLRPRQLILPFPDEQVVTSVALRIQWVLETGSVDAVAERIRDGSDGWPVRNAVPDLPRDGTYVPGMQAGWKKLVADHLRRWLRSPALYGIYSVYMDALLPLGKRRRQPGRVKGVHYGRAISRRLPPLPDAMSLLIAPDATPGSVAGVGSAGRGLA